MLVQVVHLSLISLLRQPVFSLSFQIVMLNCLQQNTTKLYSELYNTTCQKQCKKKNPISAHTSPNPPFPNTL